MPMIYLTDLLPYVIPYAAGCPDMVAAQGIRRAAIEFCARTKCWRHKVTQTITDREVTIDVPAHATIHLIDRVSFGDDDLDPVLLHDTVATDMAQDGSPHQFTQVTPNTILFWPYAEGDLTVTAFLKPRNGQAYGQNGAGPTQNYFDQIPDFVFANYVDQIAHGALSHILSLPGQTFTDMQAAMTYKGMFEAGMNRASTDYLRGQQRAPLRTKTLWA